MTDIKTYELKEVAKILNVTRRTLNNYIEAGKMPAIKIGGKWVVTEEALKKFLKLD